MKVHPVVGKLGLSLIAAILAFFICLLVRPTWKADCSFYFPLKSPSAAGLSALKVGPGQGDPGSVDLLNSSLVTPLPGSAPSTAISILTSYSSIMQIVDQLNLTNEWHVSEKVAFLRVKKYLSADVDDSGNILNVSYLDSNQDLAAKIVKVVGQILDAKSKDLSLNIGRSNRIFVGERLSASKARLAKSASALEKAASQGTDTTSETLFKTYLDQKSILTGTEASYAGLEAKLEAISKGLKDYYSAGGPELLSSSPGVTSANGELASISNQLGQRKIQLEDALAKYQKNTGEVKNAERDYNSVHSLAVKANSRLLAGVAGKYDPALVEVYGQKIALAATLQKYRDATDALYQKLMEAPATSVQFQSRMADFKRSEEQVSSLSAQYELAKIAEQRDPSRFEVLDAPHIDPSYVFPHKGLIAGSVFVLVFVLTFVPNLRKVVIE